MSGGAISDYSPEIMRAWSANQRKIARTGSGTSMSTGSSTTNNTEFNNISQYGDWLQGFGSILSGLAGYKSYQLGKDQLAFSKEAFNFNKDLQLASALAQAQGRLSEMQAYGTRQDLSYLQNLINTLQSYGQNAQNTALPNTMEGTQGFGTQQPQQQNAQTLLNQPSALSWNNSPLSDVSTPRDTAIRPDDLRFARR